MNLTISVSFYGKLLLLQFCAKKFQLQNRPDIRPDSSQNRPDIGFQFQLASKRIKTFALTG